MPQSKKESDNPTKYLRDTTEKVINLRDKEVEFHGLEREFMIARKELLVEFQRTKNIRHPRDLGDSRENILKKFLRDSGFLPPKYAISEGRARAASSTGHLSPELDIVFFDPNDTTTLMLRNDVYKLYPIESLYGTVQVKSILSRKELIDGLDNLRAFKSLQRDMQGAKWLNKPENRQFSVLFAYDSKMKWRDMVNTIKDYSMKESNTTWVNFVCVLNQGIILHGQDQKFGSICNRYVEKIDNLVMYGFPDRDGSCLYSFVDSLLALLDETNSWRPPMGKYRRLPLTCGGDSYSNSFGALSERLICQKHDEYLLKLKESKMEEILSFCRNAEPINWIKATDIAYGHPGDREEAYKKQSGIVRIYNPDNLGLGKILIRDSRLGEKIVPALFFNSFHIEDMDIWIPSFYADRDGLFEECPKCLLEHSKSKKRQGGNKNV